MEFINPKFKYIFASILLLGGFLCGYNFKQWYVTNHRNEKHISLIYSCSKKEADRGQFEELLKKEFSWAVNTVAAATPVTPCRV